MKILLFYLEYDPRFSVLRYEWFQCHCKQFGLLRSKSDICPISLFNSFMETKSDEHGEILFFYFIHLYS